MKRRGRERALAGVVLHLAESHAHEHAHAHTTVGSGPHMAHQFAHAVVAGNDEVLQVQGALGPVGADLRRLQEAYRLARRPVPTAEEVPPLPVSMTDVRAWLTLVEGTTA